MRERLTNTFLVLLLLLTPFLTKAQCKYESNLGESNALMTKNEWIYQDLGMRVGVQFKKENYTHILQLRIEFYGKRPIEIQKGDVLEIKMENDTILEVKAASTVNGFVKSGSTIATPAYHCERSTIEMLSNNMVQAFRINYQDRYLDGDMRKLKKKALRLKMAAPCIL